MHARGPARATPWPKSKSVPFSCLLLRFSSLAPSQSCAQRGVCSFFFFFLLFFLFFLFSLSPQTKARERLRKRPSFPPLLPIHSHCPISQSAFQFPVVPIPLEPFSRHPSPRASTKGKNKDKEARKRHPCALLSPSFFAPHQSIPSHAPSADALAPCLPFLYIHAQLLS